MQVTMKARSLKIPVYRENTVAGGREQTSSICQRHRTPGAAFV